MRTIHRAVVVGSGALSAGVAADFANAGVPVQLLGASPETLKKTKFFTPDAAALVTFGTLEQWNGEGDWVLVEDPALLPRVARDDAVVSSLVDAPGLLVTRFVDDRVDVSPGADRELLDFIETRLGKNGTPETLEPEWEERLERAGVAVIAGRVVDAALERAMSATRIVAAAGSQIGFTTTPKNGGCTAMIRRVLSPVMKATPNADPVPVLQLILQAIAMHKVAASADEARLLGFLTAADRIVMNRHHVLRVAKEEALALEAAGTAPRPRVRNCYAAGRDARAALKSGIHQLKEGGYINEEGAEISGRVAHVLCGGEISSPQWVDEEYFLKLEATMSSQA